jgi:hypothetical protein
MGGEVVVMPEEDKPEMLWAASIYGAQTKRGLVELTVRSEQVKISPTEARAFAYSILEAAEAAETDEMIVKWLMERVQQPIENVVSVLRDFRELRDQQRDARRGE